MAPRKKLCICPECTAVKSEGLYFAQSEYLAHLATRNASPPSGTQPDKIVTIKRRVAVEQFATQAVAKAVEAQKAQTIIHITAGLSQIRITEPDRTPEITERLSKLSIGTSRDATSSAPNLKHELKQKGNARNSNLTQRLAVIETRMLALHDQLKNVQDPVSLEAMLTETRWFYAVVENIKRASDAIQKSRKHLLATLGEMEKQLEAKANSLRKLDTKPLYYDSGKFSCHE